MKLLDEKGRLFGKINLLDLCILLVLALAIVFGIKRFFLKPDESKMMRPAKLTFEITDVRQVTLDTIKEGHMLYWTDRSRPIGKIEKVEHIPFEQPLEKNGEWVNMPVPGKYSVTLTISADVKDDGNAFWLGGEQVRVGIKYLLKTKYINIEAYLVGLDVDEK